MKENRESIEDNEEDIRLSPSVLHLVEYAISFVSGMCFEKTSGTALNEIGLPYIPADELVADMLIQKLP